MAGLLVYVHHDDGEFSPQGLGLLAKAAGLGGDVTAFVAGSGIDDGWAGSLGGHGASKVLVADDAALGGLSQPIVDALAPSAAEADAVLFGAGVVSADVAAGLAARLGAGIACETTDIAMADGGLVATRPALDDTVMVESGFSGGPGIVLARANAFPVREDASGSAPLQRYLVELVPQERMVLRSNAMQVLLEAARAGLGCAVLSCLAGEAEPGLRRVAAPRAMPAVPLWLLYHEDLRRSPRLRAAVAFLDEVVAAHRSVLVPPGFPFDPA